MKKYVFLCVVLHGAVALMSDMSCPGERFTPGGLYASGGDSRTPVTGKYTANYISYKSDVWWSVRAERLVQQYLAQGKFTSLGLYDARWDAATPLKGKFIANSVWPTHWYDARDEVYAGRDGTSSIPGGRKGEHSLHKVYG